MSYDVSLVVDTGGPEPAEIDRTWRNYTSNIRLMARRANCGIPELDGRRASDAAWRIEMALAKMRRDPAGFEALNPENGWGDFEGFREWLAKLMLDCRAHPKATVRVSW